MPVKYPVARSGAEVLNTGLSALTASAYRRSDALKLCESDVHFTSELVGPEFSSQADGLDYYKGLVEDDRPGQRFSPDVEKRFLELKCLFKRGCGRPKKLKRTAGVETSDAPPFYTPPALATYWRLSVTYWRIMEKKRVASTATLTAYSDKKSRRKRGKSLSAEELAAIANTPLRSLRPQLGMTIGLFEVPLPENPALLIPDE